MMVYLTSVFIETIQLVYCKPMFKISTFGLFMFVVCGMHVEITLAATTTSAVSTATNTHDAVAVEKRVREYFTDIPVMIEIARCESKFRQFTDSGSVLRGGGSEGMIGIFQFYEVIHKQGALALGFDINTIEGNIGYARYLYTQSGTTPWASCVPNIIPAATSISAANNELQIKLLKQVIVLLQELLKMELAKR